METPISLEELDKSLKEGNSKSAPGLDGFGMPLIKKIWDYLRHPLKNMLMTVMTKEVSRKISVGPLYV